MPRPDKITDLQAYLDSTTKKHNGWGYEAFKRMLKTSSRASMARNFGVTPNTITKWELIYNKRPVKS